MIINAIAFCIITLLNLSHIVSYFLSSFRILITCRMITMMLAIQLNT
jgi:hypothetical protein